MNTKKTSRKTLETKLDKIVREIVLERDKECVCPAPNNGHSSVLQCGHLFSRAKKSLKWDLRNCSCQCSGCNLLHEYNPHRYTLAFIHLHGLCVYEELLKTSEVIYKYREYELEEMLEQLKLIREKQIANPEWKPYFKQADILSGAWVNE